MRKRINHNGEKHGRLTIIKDIEDGIRPCGQTYRRVECACECGNTIQCALHDVLNGSISSCKCYRHDYFTKHGCNMADSPYKRVYNIYCDMKRRCYNKNTKHYVNYGGRGIKVCEEWINDFEKFLTWSLENGYKDSLTIDRINNDGNYEPSNCRWTSQKEQSNNKRTNHKITICGITMNLNQWCDFLHIKIGTYKTRKKLGWNDIDSLIKPLKYGNNVKEHSNRVNKLMSEYARRMNL